MSGYRAQELDLACIKTLSKSELLDQKEFNGVIALKRIFGNDNKELVASFSIRGSDVKVDVDVTWYEARASNESRSEFRFYYEPNYIMNNAQPGDNIVIGFNRSGKLQCILFKNGSEEHQGEYLSWATY